MPVALSEVDRDLGHAVFAAVTRSQRWIHRKVETLSMLVDEDGRRKVSIDCTPELDERLFVGSAAGRQSYLPLAILAKVQIRDIDIRDAGGGALPMAERSTFERLEVSALVAQIEQKGNSVSDALLRDLNAVVRSKPERARLIADEVLSGIRTYEGFDIATLPPVLRRFIRDLAGGFLLIVVVNADAQGVRSVFKYSTYWPQPSPRRFRWRTPAQSVRRAISSYLREVGWFPFHFLIDVSGAAFAASYHLQVNIPEGLAYDRLELPRSESSSARVDIERSGIAHGGAHFDVSADEDAVLIVRNPSAGRLGSVVRIGVLSFIILGAFAWTPLIGVIARSPANVESTLGLLVLVPAALITLGSRTRENSLAAEASRSLRSTANVLAACYLLLAASLVVLAELEGYRSTLHGILIALWGVATVVSIPVWIGLARTRHAEEHYRRSPDPDEYDDYHAEKLQASKFWRRFGVEESVLRVATVESDLTVLGGATEVSQSRRASASAALRAALTLATAKYRASGPEPATPRARDRVVEQIARSASSDLQVLGRDETGVLFVAEEDEAAIDALVGHARGRRVLPASETVDYAMGVAAPSGSIVRPPAEWMTVVAMRRGVFAQLDPKVPLAELLRMVRGTSGRDLDDPLNVVVPEGGINDRVVRLVREARASSVRPERAAAIAAIDVMTGSSSAPIFYGTVGTTEGVVIAAAARLLAAPMHGSFGSPDLLFASGGVGRYAGYYSAEELVRADPVLVAVASREEIDILEPGMDFPARSVSGGGLTMVLADSSFPADIVSGVRAATEAAATACRPWIGKRDKIAADAAAVAAMRDLLNEVPFYGVVVIGEGEKDRAPMLANGEELGRGGAGPYDVAVDPLDGTRLVAEGIPGSICVIALAPRGSMYDPRNVFYMQKLIAGPAGVGVLDLLATPTENVERIAKAKSKLVRDVTVVVLDKPRHRELVAELRTTGAQVRLVGEGDVSSAVLAALDDSGVDLVMGTGGTPEGIVAACAIRALGGFMQARLDPQSEEQRVMAAAEGHDLARVFTAEDLVSSDQVLFVSAPVT